MYVAEVVRNRLLHRVSVTDALVNVLSLHQYTINVQRGKLTYRWNIV